MPRYFAITLSGEGGEQTDILLREIEDDEEYRLESLRPGGEWALDYEMGGYLFNGEVGAEEIDEERARQVASKITNEENIAEPRQYQRALSPYEKRVDFEAARKVFDEDAWDADLKIRQEIKKTLATLLQTVKERIERGMLTPQWVGTMTVATPPAVLRIVGDYLMNVWRKGRDLALKELPEKVSKGLADVKRFAGLEPTKAVEYLLNTRPWLVKGIIDDELKKRTRLELGQHLLGGRTTTETIGRLRDIFEPWIGDPEKITPTGQRGIGFPPGEFAPENILMAYRLENIIRTESIGAFAQGRAAVGDEADDYVIGYELSPILDVDPHLPLSQTRGSPPCNRIRELIEMDRPVLFRKDDPRAIKLLPPLMWNCRTINVFVVADDLPVRWSTEAELDSIVRLIPEGFK